MRKMGAAAQQRGDKVIAQQTEYKYSVHEMEVAKRQLNRENQRLASLVETQAAELEQLRAQVAEIEVLRQQHAETATALTTAEQSRDHFRSLWRELNTIHADRIAAHTKLSEIVKLALTPEEYHRYREMHERLQDMVPVRD